MSSSFITPRRAVVASTIALLIGSSLMIATSRAQGPTTSPATMPTTQSVEEPGKKVVAPSGLIMITTKEGIDAVVQKDDLVLLDYTGKLLNGKVFDSTRDPGHQPAQVTVGSSAVMKGWNEGLIGMKFMEKRQLILPPELGYGKEERPDVPANSTLVYDMQVVGIARKPK